MAAENRNHLPVKPTVGGSPIRPSRPTSSSAASTGERRCSPASDSMETRSRSRANLADHQEAEEGDGGVPEAVEQGRGQPGAVQGLHPDQGIAAVGHGGVPEEPLEVPLPQGRQVAQGHGQHAHHMSTVRAAAGSSWGMARETMRQRTATAATFDAEAMKAATSWDAVW